MPWWDRFRPFLRHEFPKILPTTKTSKTGGIVKGLTQAFRGKLANGTSDYGGAMTSQLKSRYDIYKKMVTDTPERIRHRALDMGKKARKSASRTTTEMTRKLMGSMTALPLRAAKALRSSMAAGTKTFKVAMLAGTRATARATARASRQAIARALGIFPGLTLYAMWIGRRVVYLLFGMAFLYGLGNSIPGAVVQYVLESEKQRQSKRISTDEERREAPALPKEV